MTIRAVSDDDCPVLRDGEDINMTDHDENQEFPCILKVTDGAKTKFSTKVRQNISVLMSTTNIRLGTKTYRSPLQN